MKRKILILCISLAIAGACLALCFIDKEPFYPAKIAGTVIITIWGFSAVPAYAAAISWMRACTEKFISNYVFLIGTWVLLLILPLLLAPFFMVYYYIPKNL